LLVLDRKAIAVVRWKLRRGDSNLRVQYDLDPKSVVFDVGAYRGDWVHDIASRYDCHIHAFEPISAYCDEIRRRFGANPKIVINNTGLAGKTAKHLISIDEAGSSVVKLGGKTAEIQLIDIAEYVGEHGIDRIDLLKMNIEGGEYELLERMHEIDLVRRCTDIQIQFHDFVPDAEKRREEARAKLRKTHDLTYDYPFIWENWHLRGAAA
jgi:FkbM family methyltransferase